jgi:predicted amidohydrolase YtcJ
VLAATGRTAQSQDTADLILHSGKIVTVDNEFTIAEALAVKDGRILAVGDDAAVLASRGDATKVVDLGGKMVLPGLIDSHVHATGASMTEEDHPIPDMETIGDVLDYIRGRAEVVPKGEWIVMSQVFITRLREQRYPTKAELDAAAPEHPVAFRTGPDASVNSLALARSGIDKDFRPTGSGVVERDPQTGEPNGILRSADGLLKVDERTRSVGHAERDERLEMLLKDYNSVGITAAIDRNAGSSAIDQYYRMHSAGRLTVRMGLSHSIDGGGETDAVTDDIREIGSHPLRQGDDMLRIIGVKAFLDGGMLTGSAYMREPWGVSRIYGIDDPQYRGLKYIEHDKLVALVRTCVENDLQFTAHSVGDGAVHALLDAYEEVSKDTPVSKTRCCITHSNFMSREALEQAARLGVVLDIQPAWLYLDARTLQAQFGYDRLRYFQPLATAFALGAIAGGGSDHMQKIGSLRSINPYNPFLGMWVTLTRKARWYDGQLHPEEALTREQAIRFYTANNAVVCRMEDQIGSLEAGKLADFIVLDRDLLTCPVDDVRETQVLATYLGGRAVYLADESE